MDIDKMEAGREMNVIVHMEVFDEPRNVPAMRDPEYLYESSEAGWVKVEAPPYSTDISAAWQVVEKMSETWEFSLNYQDNKYKFLLWKPEWVTSNLYQARECKEGVSNTVPLAIGRASLKCMVK